MSTTHKLQEMDRFYASSMKVLFAEWMKPGEPALTTHSPISLISRCVESPSVSHIFGDGVRAKAAIQESRETDARSTSLDAIVDDVWIITQTACAAVTDDSREDPQSEGANSECGEDALGSSAPEGFLTPGFFLAALLATPNNAFSVDGFQIAQTGLLRAGHSSELVSSKLFERRAEIQRRSFVYQGLGYGTDVTAQVEAGLWPDCPLVGMENLVGDVVCRLNSGSVCLIGEAGVGKSAFIRGLAWRLCEPRSEIVPNSAKTWRIVSVSRDDLLAGAGTEGELESRLLNLLRHIRRNPNVIVFFDEVHHLLDGRDVVGRAVVNSLKPRMADGGFRCLAATTDQEYERHIMKDEALHSRFSPVVTIREPRRDEAVAILAGAKSSLFSAESRQLGIEIELPQDEQSLHSDSVLTYVVDLTERYQRNDRLPRKALKLLQEAIERKTYYVSLKNSGVARFAQEKTTIDREFITQIARARYGPAVDREGRKFWRRAGDELISICGEETGRAMIRHLYRSAFDLHSTIRQAGPLARIGLLVDEPATANRLASLLQEMFFGDPAGIRSEDMRRFQGQLSRTLLTGAPPAYVGHDDSSSTYSRIRSRPGGVLHFQNFHAASSEIEPEILSIMDGTARDASSRKIDFSQWIVLMSDVVPTKSLEAQEPENAALKLSGLWSPRLLSIRPAIFVAGVPHSAQRLATEGNELNLPELITSLLAQRFDLPSELASSELQQRLEEARLAENISAEVALSDWFDAYCDRRLFS